MQVVINGQQGNVIFGATGNESILQNIRTIITTEAGTVPLDRGFGIDTVDTDAPVDLAKARLTNRIISAVRQWEPRAEVIEVTYEQDDQTGNLIPSVKIQIVEEGSAQ